MEWWICEEVHVRVGGVVGYLVCCEWEDVEVRRGGKVLVYKVLG